MRGGGEEVPVIGIHFPKPVFCRAREMEGVGGAEKCIRRSCAITAI